MSARHMTTSLTGNYQGGYEPSFYYRTLRCGLQTPEGLNARPTLGPAWIGMLRLRKVHCRFAAKSRNDVLYFSTLKRETRKLLSECIRLCTIASHLIIFLSEFYETSDIARSHKTFRLLKIFSSSSQKDLMTVHHVTKIMKILLWCGKLCNLDIMIDRMYNV